MKPATGYFIVGLVAVGALGIYVGIGAPALPQPISSIPLEDQPKGKAPPATDPWRRDQMAVLGSLKLPDGSAIHAVHIPGWPLPQTCMVLIGQQASVMRCDTDLASRPESPLHGTQP